MRLKRIVAALLVGVLTLPLLEVEVFASAQQQVKGEILINPITHTITNNGKDISPRFQVEWEIPQTNDGGIDHATSYYQYKVTDVLNGGASYLSEKVDVNNIDGGNTQNRLNDFITNYDYGYDALGTTQTTQYSLKNGTLYKVEVIPRHLHANYVNNTLVYSVADAEGSGSSAYVLTDFNTKIENVDEELFITWEYVPGATYNVYYVNKEMKNKNEFQDDDDGVVPITGLTDTEAKKFLKNSRIYYPIENPQPGVIYSAYVEVESFDSIINFSSNTTTPKIASGTTYIKLNIETIVGDEVRLWWDLPSWIGTNNYTLQKVYIYQKGTDEYLGTIESDSITSFLLTAPSDKVSTYYAVFQIKKKTSSEVFEVSTNEVSHTPYTLRIEPLKPFVPLPYGDNINVEEANTSERDYLVSGDSRGFGDSDFKANTFHYESGTNEGIQLVWDIPKNQLDEEKPDPDCDFELYYDIWISEDKNILDNTDLDPVVKDLKISETKTSNIIFNKSKTPVGFKYFLTQYRDTTGLLRNISSNMTYYIKIVAKRSYGQLVSGETDYEVSQPTIVAITVDKNGDIFTPPVLGKPPLTVDDKTDTTITVKWTETWHEILTKDISIYTTDSDDVLLGSIGSAKVYVDSSTPSLPLRYTYNAKFTQHILYTESDVTSVKNQIAQIAGSSYYEKNYYDRQMSLGKNIGYEVKVVPYDEIADALEKGDTIESWIYEHERTKADGTTNETGWEDIGPDERTESGLNWKLYTAKNLKPNTRYVIMLRAYRKLEDGLKDRQTFPSYIIETTLTDREDPSPDALVPTLYLDSVKDTSITVWWRYNKDFTYELVYSRKEDPETATVYEFELDKDLADGSKAYVEIKGLFPETSYNIWVRAIPNKESSDKKWSNPVTGKTLALAAPDVPRGLGTAAYQSILDVGLDFKPVTTEYITVEWLKDNNDKGTVEESGITRRYEYILSFADNVEFLDALTVTVSDDLTDGQTFDILAKNMVKFTGLVANRPYYVKVKARVILSSADQGLEISAESAFSDWVRILTKTSSEEYDGGDNDNIVIYPEWIEESYLNDVWTLEVLDTQSVISDMITQSGYYLTFTMNKYNNKIDAGERVVKLSKALVDAVIGAHMEIKIETLLGVYQIPGSVLKFYTDRGAPNDIVTFSLKTILAYDIPSIIKPLPYQLVSAEQLSITMTGSKTQPTVTKLDGLMRVKFKLTNQAQYQNENLETFTYTTLTGSWVREPYSIENKDEGSFITFQTPRLGIFGLYKLSQSTGTTKTSNSMETLLDKYDIPALRTTYNASDKVQSNQFINLMLGLAQNQSTIGLNDAVLEQTKLQATNSGLYTGSSTGQITQEEALAGVVKLYELKWGVKVTPSSKSVTGVSNAYKQAVQKAYALGFVDNFSPKSSINYDLLCTWLNSVLP